MTSLIKGETPKYSFEFTGAMLELMTSDTWTDFIELSMEEREVRLIVENIDKQRTKIIDYLKTENTLYPSPENPHFFVVYAKQQKLLDLTKEREELRCYFDETLRPKLNTIWKEMDATLGKIDHAQTKLFMDNDVNSLVRKLWQKRISPPPEAHTPKEETKESKSP